MEDLVEARYTRRKTEHLKAINLKLERLRVLLRICHELQYLPHESYEFAMRSLDSEIRRFLQDRLLLDNKERATFLAPVSQGIPFLGVRVFPGLIRLQRSGWTRFKRKLRDRERAYLEGEIDGETFVQSVQSPVGHIRHANTYHLRMSFFHT